MDILGNFRSDGEQRRFGYKLSARNGNNHSHFGHDQRVRHVDRNSRRVKFDCCYSQHRIGRGRVDPAVHRNRDLQRRHDQEPDHDCELDFVEHRRGNDRGSYRISDGRRRRHRHDHGQFGQDKRLGHTYSHSGAHFDFGGAQPRIDCKRSYAAIYGDGYV